MILQHRLACGRQRCRGPVAVVAELPGGLARLARTVPALDAYPCLEIPAHSADGAYPRLGWQPRAAKTAVQRVAGHGPWLRVRPACKVFGKRFKSSACHLLSLMAGSRARRRPPCSASPATGPGCGCVRHAGLQ